MFAERPDRMTGDLVQLRPLRRDDIPAMVGALGSGSVAPVDVGLLRERVELQPTLELDGFWGLAVVRDSVMVGDIQARAPRFAFPPGVCEVGVSLFPDARGQGLGTDAVRVLTARLHADGWARVQASTAAANAAMRAALLRCGYREEGVLRCYAPDERGGRADYVMYASVPGDHRDG